jgi:phosphocarrier protein
VSETTLTISNERGLHARAAAKFVKLVGEFDAEVLVTKDGQEVSGLSIMGLLMLAAGPGDEIVVRIEGADETSARQALIELIENKFEEK